MNERRPGRVLMTADTVGGVWNWALTLARGLAGRGVEVMLATLGGMPEDAQREEAALISGLTLRTSGYKLEWMEDPWRDVAESAAWLARLEHEFAPDLVHLNTFGHAEVQWSAPVVMTAHSCVVSWWRAVKGTPLPPEWSCYRAQVRRALEAADLVTAPSRSMRDTLAANYGDCLPECRAIYNAAGGAFFELPKQPFVLTAGRLWDEAKNAAAMARIAGQLPWPVYLAGEYREPMANCRMLGRLSSESLRQWYAPASIYALPARYEPFGLSPLEAALSGCALVLGNIESLREVWGDSAVFVDPDDDTSLLAAIEDLITRPEYRAQMAHRARERAQAFTPDRMTEAYLDAYGAATANSRRLACAS
jgi:glycogen(starch) synthase